MTRFLLILLAGALLSPAAFFKTRIGDLVIEGDPAALLASPLQPRDWRGGPISTNPKARFETFAFIVPDFDFSQDDWVERNRWGNSGGRLSAAWLIVEMDEAKALKGFLDVWVADEGRWESLSCEAPLDKLVPCKKEEAEDLLTWRDQHLLATGARGGLWLSARSGREAQDRPQFEFDRTFTIMSGGRALAENLALDRDLILGQGEDKKEVALAEIQGVTVAPIAWEERLPEGEVVVEALSKRVPDDQHFLVVPTLDQFFDLTDRLERTATPLLESFGVSRDFRELPSRYRRQMGLDLPEALARFLPIDKVGVTGGDPFFPTGSDVAVIFETDKVDFVYGALEKAIAAKARLAGAQKEAEGLAYQNQDRSFSSHLAKLEGAVVISNSAHQLTRLRAVAEGKVESLGATAEYRFFRHRYPVDQGESAYLFISDACLRRWAGPEVRIGASRRNRAMSALARVSAGHLANGELDPSYRDLLGEVTLLEKRVLSEHYGSLAFLTPIGELGITKVSGLEKDGYERWRRGYENGWSQFFDPIAIQLTLSEKREAMDMTILPLRVDSDYEDIMELAGKATLSRASREVPEASVFHFAMAIDKESELFGEASVSLVNLLPSLSVNPLGWMGESFSVTLGESPVWQHNLDEEALVELPALVRVDVASRLKLALFMTAVKGTVESSAPGLVRWEPRQHGERKYVAMIGNEEEIGSAVSIYYATLPTALLVSLNEEMLKTAIEREEKIDKNRPGGGQILAQATPEFVSSMGLQMADRDLTAQRRSESYQALPVLNEWYCRWKTADPLAAHLARFGEKLTCPGGKGYRWNDQDLTMESVTFGHPGRQRQPDQPAELFAPFNELSAEGSFEDGGLRMKIALEQKRDDAKAEVPQDEDKAGKEKEE